MPEITTTKPPTREPVRLDAFLALLEPDAGAVSVVLVCRVRGTPLRMRWRLDYIIAKAQACGACWSEREQLEQGRAVCIPTPHGAAYLTTRKAIAA